MKQNLFQVFHLMRIIRIMIVLNAAILTLKILNMKLHGLKSKTIYRIKNIGCGNVYRHQHYDFFKYLETCLATLA